MGAGEQEDDAVRVDEPDYCDDRLANDACSDARYNDARYYTHLSDAVLADVVVPADVVVAVRMHTCLITGINMRICIFS